MDRGCPHTDVNVNDLNEGQKVWYRFQAINKVGASKALDSDHMFLRHRKVTEFGG